jgi:hypothetical protein
VAETTQVAMLVVETPTHLLMLAMTTTLVEMLVAMLTHLLAAMMLVVETTQVGETQTHSLVEEMTQGEMLAETPVGMQVLVMPVQPKVAMQQIPIPQRESQPQNPQ